MLLNHYYFNYYRKKIHQYLAISKYTINIISFFRIKKKLQLNFCLIVKFTFD